MHLIFYTWCCRTTEECIEARRDVLGACSSLDLWLSCLISHPLKGYHSLYEHTETQSLFLWQQRTETSCRHCRGELSLFFGTPMSCKIKIKPYCSAVAAPPLKACPASRQRTPWGPTPPSLNLLPSYSSFASFCLHFIPSLGARSLSELWRLKKRDCWLSKTAARFLPGEE